MDVCQPYSGEYNADFVWTIILWIHVGIRLQSCQYSHKDGTLAGYTSSNAVKLWIV